MGSTHGEGGLSSRPSQACRGSGNKVAVAVTSRPTRKSPVGAPPGGQVKFWVNLPSRRGRGWEGGRLLLKPPPPPPPTTTPPRSYPGSWCFLTPKVCVFLPRKLMFLYPGYSGEVVSDETKEKMVSYEDAMRRIQDVTGVSDVREVLSRSTTPIPFCYHFFP